ncbi:pyridoxine/pyridoxamine 5'-phosphate oxidase [Mycolicibacterium mengxianglii]|uniref:pyridoxine/pyridoxamine 5'-phosphate oxidase n=1 Tax=Mycolicibacterium mengxianglii TaxID=2736649 RepID=UPI0027DA3F09|nr:pyridoxal 5'-phosphate synthase [Mycolicibacterium mengxianglii]
MLAAVGHCGACQEFDPARVPDDPVALFDEWFCHAVDSGVPEPHAMTLATADAAGRPSARVLILKDVGPDASWHFASSAASRKGRELTANPVAALTFYWPALGRQVRVEGPVLVDPPEVSAADFLARSPTARALATAGTQSAPYTDAAEVTAALAGVRDTDVAPAHWRSYAVHAEAVEFWQSDPDRRHLRLCYRRSPDWTRTLLWP